MEMHGLPGVGPGCFPFGGAPGSLLQLDRCCGHPPIQVVLAGKCPSCHAKRLARWSLWLDQTLLAPVPHRQVVLTLPKRLRAYCLYRRPLLGDLARVAARTVTPPSAPSNC